MLQAIPLGLVTVTTAGVPAPITAALIAAAGGTLPPSGGVSRIDVHAHNGNTGIVLVKVNGVIFDNILTPANGVTGHWCYQAGSNSLNPLSFSLDVATNGDGAYVTLWVE
jgi:hypothetical protein